MRRIVFVCLASVVAVPAVFAQSFTTAPCTGPEGQTRNYGLFGMGTEHVCELRKTVLPSRGEVKIWNRNGGIEVIGQDRSDIALEARVIARAGSREDAEAVAREVKIDLGDTIRADGPSNSIFTGRSWYVNFCLLVPRHLAAQLHTVNGGIELSGLEGNARAETTNGGISLHDLAGEVHAQTTNGGINATLSGDRWNGAGLFAGTTNGGISVSLPAQYSAHLVAGTTNGGVSVGLPLNGAQTTGRHINANLGSGGATVQFETTNGGVNINGNGSRHETN